MENFAGLCFNPVLVSVLLLCIMCVGKINVLLAIIVSSIAAGLLSGMELGEIMNTFLRGMGDNSETALSYILLGVFAATMTYSGFTGMISGKIVQTVRGNTFVLLAVLTLIAAASQNIIPVHIAFIPVIIPPLLHIFNKLKLDRHSVACALAFGLKAPYIAIPAGFGLIFRNLTADNMIRNGIFISRSGIWKYTLIPQVVHTCPACKTPAADISCKKTLDVVPYRYNLYFPFF